MKERPILFNSTMVRAILDGRKTQTRRPITQRPRADGARLLPELLQQMGVGGACPYGQTGDRLWVRETFQAWTGGGESDEWDIVEGSLIGHETLEYAATSESKPARWRPSIHMPRWASRVSLEITAVRVERLQEITYDDCLAEGLTHPARGIWDIEGEQADEGYKLFAKRWNAIYGEKSWDENPWLWVITFKPFLSRTISLKEPLKESVDL